MTIERQSQAGLLLPGVFRGEPLLESMLRTGEQPLSTTSAAMEAFLDQLRPETAPAAWLPWLFWALGGEDYYRPDWSETKTRLVCSRLIDLYRSRGTVDGLGLHLSLLAGQTLLKAVQPPAKAFAGITLTEAEREAFESRHPEIRIWPFRHAGVAQTAMLGRCWPGGAGVETKGRCLPAVTDAITRVGDRLEWHDPMAATSGDGRAAVRRGADGVLELRIRGRAMGVFVSRPFGLSPSRPVMFTPRALLDHGAATRLYRVIPDPVGGRDPLAIPPSIRPMRVRTDELRLAGSGRGCWLWNRYTDRYTDRGGSHVGGPLVHRRAETRLGASLRIFDPSRLGLARRGGHPFLGGFALGTVPAHEIEAWVDMPGTVGRGTIWPGQPLRGHPAISDAARRLAVGLWAGDLARRAGCRVRMDISHRRVIRPREAIVSGGAIVGEYVMSGGAQ